MFAFAIPPRFAAETDARAFFMTSKGAAEIVGQIDVVPCER